MCNKFHLYIHYMINYTIFDVLNLVDGCIVASRSPSYKIFHFEIFIHKLFLSFHKFLSFHTQIVLFFWKNNFSTLCQKLHSSQKSTRILRVKKKKLKLNSIGDVPRVQNSRRASAGSPPLSSFEFLSQSQATAKLIITFWHSRCEKCTLWVHGPTAISGPCTHGVHFPTLGKSYELAVQCALCVPRFHFPTHLRVCRHCHCASRMRILSCAWSPGQGEGRVYWSTVVFWRSSDSELWVS